MPSALYFLKTICMRDIIHSPRVVMIYDEKEYNPQGGSLLACIVTQGRLRCTCQPCAIESITPMGYGYTVWFGAIECTMGNGTPRGLMEIGRGGACVPARVALQGRIYPNHNDTHTFLFKRMKGAGVRDAFPPPMCVG